MSILDEVKSLESRATGDVQAEVSKLRAWLESSRASALASMESEVAKGSADLKGAWSALKAHL